MIMYLKERTTSKGSKMIIFIHVSPVIFTAILFNITKFISISSIGPTLQKIPQYLQFILFFQAFHPLTTTGLAPLLILVLLNYKVILSLDHFHFVYHLYS